MTIPQDVTHLQLFNDSEILNPTGLKAGAACAPNDELLAMLGRATHAQAAVNPPDDLPLPLRPRLATEQDALTISGSPVEERLEQPNRRVAQPPNMFSGSQRQDSDLSRGRARHTPRISFEEFSSQLRLHRLHEHKVGLLRRRQECLRKSIALSLRLRRVGSGIYDGLTDLSEHGDKNVFIRVYHHLQSLIDSFAANWMRGMDNLDSLLEPESTAGSVPPDLETFVPKLSSSSRSELFGFIHSLRSNPQFLLDRIKSLSPSQLAALANSIRPREIPVAIVSPFQKPRSSQRKRFEAFSNGLEDHAMSFERSNPLAFLLFNVFGSNPDPSSPEHALRLRTWSSICASLITDAEQRYHAFIHQVLNAFATLSLWRVKDRLELFLMETLQKGAFLLESAQNSLGTFPDGSSAYHSNPFGTQEAEDFFNRAVLNLFRILNDADGGFPDSVLQIGSAVLGHLESTEDQGMFRGYVFQWFLYEFLRISITYPENEKMLLHCHISKEARTKVLHHLWSHAATSASEVLSTSILRPEMEELQILVFQMISQMVQVPVPNDLYAESPATPILSTELIVEDLAATPFIVLSATDIVRAIDTLFPPPSSTTEVWDPFISSSATAFNAQYSYTTTRLDKLRREIILLTDLATQPRLLHPAQEIWVLLLIDQEGKAIESSVPSLSTQASEFFSEPSLSHDCVQMAALKLVDRHQTPFGTPGSIHGGSLTLRPEGNLEDLFQKEFKKAQTKGDSVEALSWHKALECLYRDYPLSTLVYDDSRVLAPMFQESQNAQQHCLELSHKLETNFLDLRSILDQLKDSISEMSAGLDNVRTKMWYSVSVINSDVYENAKNISSALNNMVIPNTNETIVDSSSISSRGRRPPSSSSSSLLDQPREDTISILKAPSEHGGPKKLADAQLEMTRKWLQRNSVDNFCKGEERIHRFCMEIKMASKRLVGESMTESPVLWSSELFAQEKALYENNNTGSGSAQMSTRAPSVISEVPSSVSNFQPPRSSHRGLETGPRSHLFDSHSSPGRKGSFHSLASGRLPQELSGADKSSSGSSPGRAFSATTTTESLSSLWSQHQAFSQSGTSVSLRSRAPSTYNEIENAKIADQNAHEKGKFLESKQHDLLCLLLSDLGGPVWSSGSETDAWLQRIFTDEMIQRRLKQRVDIERLVSNAVPEAIGEKSRKNLKPEGRSKRSTSAAPRMVEARPSPPEAGELNTGTSSRGSNPVVSRLGEYSYTQGYEELLNKLTQEIDPARKLKALTDFKRLALSEARSPRAKIRQTEVDDTPRPQRSLPVTRRSSFDPRRMSGKRVAERELGAYQSPPMGLQDDFGEPEEAKVVQLLKDLLMALRPKTLFRDLQYVSAFVSSDTLGKTESGKAFLHLGLAALEYKAEVCRSMVDVADRIMAKDLIKRKASTSPTKEPSLLDVAEFWIFAAREGNAIAQRELASLYLTCPERIPIVSLPLSLSSETFKSEMMWHELTDDTNKRMSRQKLCLALHWMQQAANNGDEVAKKKMEEREMEGSRSRSSIR